MKIRTHKQESRLIVYDADRIEQPAEQLFDPDYWRGRGALTGEAPGRGSSLFIDALDSYPYTLQRPPIGFGYRSTWPLTVPADPNLPGAGLHLQPYVLDPPANGLGVVTMNATEVVIGDAALHPMRQVNSSDYLAPSGTFQYVSGIHGGAVLKLTGGFQ